MMLRTPRYFNPAAAPARCASSLVRPNAARPTAKLRRVKDMIRDPIILGVARRKLWKFFWVQYSSENLEAIDDARARAREVSAGIDQIDFSIARRRKGIESRKASEQFVIAPRKIDIVTAER